MRFHNAAKPGCAGERAVTRRGNGQHGLSERTVVDGARARPMLRKLENAKENRTQKGMMIVGMVAMAVMVLVAVAVAVVVVAVVVVVVAMVGVIMMMMTIMISSSMIMMIGRNSNKTAPIRGG